MFPAAECVFADLIAPQQYHIIQLLSRLTEMTFNFRDGFSEHQLTLYENLIQRLSIMNNYLDYVHVSSMHSSSAQIKSKSKLTPTVGWYYSLASRLSGCSHCKIKACIYARE